MIALGSAALVVLLLVVMGQSSVHLAGQNGVRVQEVVQTTDGSATTFCQAGELLPKDTEKVVMSATAQGLGPAAQISFRQGTRVVSRGSARAGWSGDQVEARVPRVERTLSGIRACIKFEAGDGVALTGTREGTTNFDTDRPATESRIAIKYLRGTESWWAIAPTIAHRLGLGRAWTGTWITFLIAALILLTVGLALGWAVRELTRPANDEPPSEPDETPSGTARPEGVRALVGRVPRAAWVCAAVAFLNAFTWSLITPAFQARDERDHLAYVQQLAETGKPPSNTGFDVSREELLALDELKFDQHATSPNIGVWSSIEQHDLEQALGGDPGRVGGGSAGTAATQPPLYYALEVVPYRLGGAGSLLHRLALMRVLSALLGALAALFVFLFVREALPAVPAAWTVAGLATALQPVFGYVAGGVNADALLFATSAALFYCLARAFRRGLTTQLAVAIGAACAVGLLTKSVFIAFVPGVLLALLVLAMRERRDSGLAMLRLPAIAFSVALLPLAFDSLLDLTIWERDSEASASGISVVGDTFQPTRGGLLDQINYIWQWYLPRLPGTADFFPDMWSTRDWWLRFSVGQFGYGGLAHAQWVYDVALALVGIAIALATASVVRARRFLRSRVAELTVYALMAAALMLGIGMSSYSAFEGAGPFYLTQPRYFWPLAALAAAAIALVARGGGRRWVPAIGGLILVAIVAQSVGGQLLVIAKWYA